MTKTPSKKAEAKTEKVVVAKADKKIEDGETVVEKKAKIDKPVEVKRPELKHSL